MLKRSWILACTIVLLMVCATLGTSTPLANNMGPYQAPEYCEGDVWVYAYGEKRTKLTHRVLRVADGLVETDNQTVADCVGCRFIFDRNLVLQQMLRADGVSIPAGAGRKYWEFPLEVGKTWQYATQENIGRTGAVIGGTSRWTEVTLLVEAFEDVTVPAGTFRAFRTRRDFYVYAPGFRMGGTRWSHRFWFAPAVKWVVKFTSTKPGEQEWELTSYYLKCQP